MAVRCKDDFSSGYSLKGTWVTKPTADGTVTNVVATPEPTTSSVSEINGATAAVAATEGAILVSNYNGAAAVYTTDGRLAANAEVNGSASINVAAGLYIVRTGNKATKVIVK